MLDPNKWKIAVARFSGYCANLPSFPKEEDVEDFHGIVKALEEASGADLSSFKIPPEKLKHRIASVQRAPYGGGQGRVVYAKDKTCDSNYFEGQIEALKHYLPTLEENRQKSPYDHLQDWQLEDLMINRRIKPKQVIENGKLVYKHDREYIIAALMKQDSPQPAPHSTTLHIYDSNVNYSSPGASITENVGSFNKDELANLVDGFRQLLADTALNHEDKNEVNVNIQTIEVQLTAARPNVSILKESLKSIKTVCENAAGSLIAAGLLPAIHNILSKL